MSMWLNYAKLSPSSFERIRKEPSLVETLFFDSSLAAPKDFDGEADVYGEDYLSISSMLEASGDEDEDEDEEGDASPLDEATGAGARELDYEFCYGNAFVFEPA